MSPKNILNFDPDQTVRLARDLRRHATAPQLDDTPTARHSSTASLADALDAAIARINRRGHTVQTRLCAIADDAETFVCTTTGIDDDLADDLECLA